MGNTSDINERSRQQRYRILYGHARDAHSTALEQTRKMSEQFQQIPEDDTEAQPVDRDQQHRWSKLAEEADSLAGGWSETARRYNQIAEGIRKILDSGETAAWEEKQVALGNIPPRGGRKQEK